MAAPITRGRFYVEDTSGDVMDSWQVVDRKHGSCVGFENKTRAKREATFCRAYVKRWGDISLHAYPFSLDDPFTDEHRHANETEGGL